MKKFFFVLLILFVLCGGCARTQTAIGPDGRPIHYINCSGSLFSIGDCLENAGKLCPHGYDVINSHEGYAPGIYGDIVTKRNLIVQCKENREKIF